MKRYIELVLNTADVVPRHESAVGRLVVDQLAPVVHLPVRLPVDGQRSGATSGEGLHVSAAQLLAGYVGLNKTRMTP